jgi:hypothetical protein
MNHLVDDMITLLQVLEVTKSLMPWESSLNMKLMLLELCLENKQQIGVSRVVTKHTLVAQLHETNVK